MRYLLAVLTLWAALVPGALASRPGPSPGLDVCQALAQQALYFAIARDLGAPEATARARVAELMRGAPEPSRQWVFYAFDFVYAGQRPADPFERATEFGVECIKPGV